MTDTTAAPPPQQAGRKAKSAAPANGDSAQMMVLDFGKRSGRKIKRLRKGKGPLMARLTETIDEFVRSDMIPPAAPVVVVVVKKRKKSRGLFG